MKLHFLEKNTKGTFPILEHPPRIESQHDPQEGGERGDE